MIDEYEDRADSRLDKVVILTLTAIAITLNLFLLFNSISGQTDHRKLCESMGGTLVKVYGRSSDWRCADMSKVEWIE